MKEMLITRIAGFCFVVFLMLSGVAAAQGPYMSVNMGMGFLEDSDLSGSKTGTLEYDPGFAATLAGGYNFGMFRAEGEFGYQMNDVDTYSGGSGNGDVAAYSFLVNGYVDFVNKTAFTPYLTIGLGMAQVECNDFLNDADDTVFAYQVGAGVGYAITEKITVDLKYRYFGTDDPEFDGVESEFASHNVYLGLRYNF